MEFPNFKRTSRDFLPLNKGEILIEGNMNGFHATFELHPINFERFKALTYPSYIYHSKRKGNMRCSKVCGKYNNKPRVF